MDTAPSPSIVEDFRRARFRADLQGVLARLTGQPSELLAYDEVRQRLRGVESAEVRHQEVPLDAIVGSVGRYHDFNRLFLPLRDSDQERWVRVKAAMTGMSGVPPVELYRIGDAYFVKDGNHRVSVARQLGAKTIDAYVREVQTPVPLSPKDTPDDLIIKAEYAEFLEATQLHRLRPEADLRVSVPGGYQVLLEHIQVHQYFMGLDEKREVGFHEAAAHWYDTVYLPVVTLLRERGLLEDFPDRTPTDLYLWLAEYRAQLERELGWTLSADVVTLGASSERQPKAREALVREADPRQFLLRAVLVAFNGAESGWRALEQALLIARREPAALYGLHVIPRDALRTMPENGPENGRDPKGEHANEHADEHGATAIDALRRAFEARCAEAGVRGQLAVEEGSVVAKLAERARWADLVVAPLTYPPGQAEVKPGGGFPALLRRVPRPVLAVPGEPSALARPLLAYSGTAKAEIALFAAAYLASRWQARLRVVTVRERGTAKALEKARSYLERHGVEAEYLQGEGAVVNAILKAAAEHEADLIIAGSYEYPSLLEPLLGGVLDELLRQTPVPLLVCQ